MAHILHPHAQSPTDFHITLTDDAEPLAPSSSDAGSRRLLNTDKLIFGPSAMRIEVKGGGRDVLRVRVMAMVLRLLLLSTTVCDCCDFYCGYNPHFSEYVVYVSGSL